MSTLAATVRALVAAGGTPEMILAVVEAHEAAQTDTLTSRRSRDAARQRAKRERDQNAECHVTSRDVTEDHVTERDDRDSPHSLPPSPQTPQPPTHTPVEVTTRARTTALDKPNGFARFWEAYPNKVAKPAAEKAYAKACREIDDPDPPAVLLEGLERAKHSRQWVDGYIPHPTTWLNQGRWADQPAEIPTQKANPHDRPRQIPGNDREARRGVWAEVLAEERGEGIGDLARAG